MSWLKCWSIQVADNLPLYGVCCLMEEIVHKPPAIVDDKQPSSPPRLGRYLVSAPRCYCFLTHYPFFSLHMKVSLTLLHILIDWLMSSEYLVWVIQLIAAEVLSQTLSETSPWLSVQWDSIDDKHSSNECWVYVQNTASCVFMAAFLYQWDHMWQLDTNDNLEFSTC